MIIFPDIRLLHDSSNEFLKIAQRAIEECPDPIVMSSVQPIVVNFSFALELMLKTLYYKETSKYIRGHKFDKMFTQLSSESQYYIRKEYLLRLEKIRKANKLKIYNLEIFKGGSESKLLTVDPTDLDKILITHSNSFQSWRYFFELPIKENRHFLFDMRAMYAFYASIRSRFFLLQFGESHKHL